MHIEGTPAELAQFVRELLGQKESTIKSTTVGLPQQIPTWGGKTYQPGALGIGNYAGDRPL